MWRKVEYPGYENKYEVNENGQVKSLGRVVVKSDGVVQHRKERILKWVNNSSGYPTVHLCNNGKDVRVGVHILVAMAFVDNPYEYREVNHKDFNRRNPYYENLEWVSHRDNVSYSHNKGRYAKPQFKKGGNPRARKTCILDNGLYFDSAGECAEWLIDNGYTQGSIDNARREILKASKRKRRYLGFMFDVA